LFNEDPDLVFYGARGYFEDIGEMTDLTEFFYNDIFYPTGYMWVFPMSGTKGNVGAFITEGALQRSGMRLEDLFDWWRDNTALGNKRLRNARLLGEIKGWRLPACREPRDNYADGALVAGDAGNMIEAAFGGGQDLAMLAGKDAAETIIEAREIGDYSAETLSRYKKKLIDSQKGIYDIFNLGREYALTEPDDLNELVRIFKDKAESEKIPLENVLADWVMLKMQKMS
jgi:flavin-dependent dehydrogenase